MPRQTISSWARSGEIKGWGVVDRQGRIDQLTMQHNDAASKLDYFILGVTLAICAYLAQTNPYGKIGLNKETLLLGTLFVFAFSAIFGFKRLESAIKTARLNTIALGFADPAATQFYVDKLKDDKTGHRYYVIRNRLLFAGLLCYVTTQVWAAYQSTG